MGEFKDQLIGKKIVNIRRRAKFLIFELSSGQSLLLHLMLGGWMYLGSEMDTPDRTKQVIISMGNKQLQFIGLRLGYLHLLAKETLEEELSNLGPELNDITQQQWINILEARRGKVKTTLINQEVFAGIGNLYSDEICFHAMIHPEQSCNNLDSRQLVQLYKSMIEVMKEALQFWGYMDHPLYKQDTLTGSFYEERPDKINFCLVDSDFYRRIP